MWETICLDSTSFPRSLQCRPRLVKSFLSLLISNIDPCWYALALFNSFLLNDLISLFTHEDCIKSYLCGTLTTVILAETHYLSYCLDYCESELVRPVLLRNHLQLASGWSYDYQLQ